MAETAVKRIVVGVDGSEHALDALRWAAGEARLRTASLEVVGVFHTTMMSSGFEVVAPDPAVLETATAAMLDAAIDTVDREGLLEGITVERSVLLGHTGEVLLGRSESAELLVVGARGHGGFLGLMLGSVSTYCSQHARCPTVIVPAAR